MLALTAALYLPGRRVPPILGSLPRTPISRKAEKSAVPFRKKNQSRALLSRNYWLSCFVVLQVCQSWQNFLGAARGLEYTQYSICSKGSEYMRYMEGLVRQATNQRASRHMR